MVTTDTHNYLAEFVENFHKTRDRYLQYALRFVHNPDVAEDLINESFANLWEKRSSIPDDTIIERYFYTIIKNVCLNWLRNRETHYRVENKIYDASYKLLQYEISMLENFDPNQIFTNEIQEILTEQLAKMPALTRQIFMDNRFSDLTYEEIAAKHSISVFKVTREIHTAISLLRISLQDYLPAYLVAYLCASSLKN